MRSFIVVPMLFLCFTIPAAYGIDVQGHRGARTSRPENTLAAFDYALKVGVDTLELDLSVSRDGEVVVLHDQFIPATLCLGPGGREPPPYLAVYSLSLAALKTFDCGSLKNPNFPDQVPVPGEKIPTLAEVFTHVRQSKHPAAQTVRFNIETKINPNRPDLSPPPEEFVRRVLAVVVDNGMLERTMLQSFDPRTLIAARGIEPRLRLAGLIDAEFPGLVAEAKKLGVHVVSPYKDKFTPATVKALHDAKIGVIPWTANTKKDWERLVAMGVDGIITDDPEGLIHYLLERGLRKKKP